MAAYDDARMAVRMVRVVKFLRWKLLCIGVHDWAVCYFDCYVSVVLGVLGWFMLGIAMCRWFGSDG